MSKIIKTEDNYLEFDNGNYIDCYHCPACCEWNYADFAQIDDIARETDFDTENMMFEKVDGAGFKFGNLGKMFFVPCYSEQNGYYSFDLNVYYKDKLVLECDCEGKGILWG